MSAAIREVIFWHHTLEEWPAATVPVVTWHEVDGIHLAWSDGKEWRACATNDPIETPEYWASLGGPL